MKILIDNGHGIDTKGKRSPDGRLLEYAQNRLLPGRCRHLGLLRNYLAEGDCAAGVVSVVIPGYAGVWGFDLDQFQVYTRFILLDSVTGYRSQYHEYATLIRATEGTAIVPASQED